MSCHRCSEECPAFRVIGVLEVFGDKSSDEVFLGVES
jgi:hypothetical protein